MDCPYKKYSLETLTPQLDDIGEALSNVAFKKAESVGRRAGGSAERGKLSSYSYVNTKVIFENLKLYVALRTFGITAGFWDQLLVHYFLQLEEGDFLDIQDYWVGKQTIGEFFAISLTDDNEIEICDELVEVPKYHAIKFSQTNLHQVYKVSDTKQWLVLILARNADFSAFEL